MAKLILSAFSDEYSDNLTEQLEAMQKFGIGYIELRHADGKNVSEMTYGDVTGVIEKCNAYGIGVSAIGSPLGKIAIDGDIDAHMELAKRVCETAARLNAKNVRMFSFYLPDGEDPKQYRGAVVDAVGRMLEIAFAFGVTLCHENEAKIYGETPARCADLLSYFGSKLRAVFDMGNFVLDGHKPYPDAYDVLFPHIEYFHIKDALYQGAIVPAGRGEAQIGEVLRDYCKRGEKDTFITLEPHLETFAGLNALVGKKFENPYKYENAQAAFADAVASLGALIGEMA